MIINDFVSVIITTYNRKEKLYNAINSVLNQTYKNYELIIIDDNSTEDIEQGLRDNFRGIKYYKNATNLGVSASRNKGIEMSSYETVAFLDDDDEWLPNKLQICMNEMMLGNYDFIFTQFFKNELAYPDTSKVDNNFIFKSILQNPLVSPSTLLCKKRAIQNIGLFNEDIKCFEDYELSLRISKDCSGKFIPLALTKVNYSENSLSSDSNAIEGLKTRTALFIKYNSFLKKYKLEKEWLRGLTNFQYFMDYEVYKKLIHPIEMLMGFDFAVERNYIKEEMLDRIVPFKFFNLFDRPFWSVTAKIYVDKLVMFCKKYKYSFYGSMSYILLQACNNVKNLRLRKEGNYIFDYHNLQAQFTVLTKSGNADITRRIKNNDFITFINNFNELKQETYNESIPSHHLEIYDDVIFLSCLPWFDFSQLEPVMNYRWNDYVPRITWGKYFIENNHFSMHIALTVHHALVDGFHIQQLLCEIEKQIDLLVDKK